MCGLSLFCSGGCWGGGLVKGEGMNVAPQELKGKVIKDCYQDRDGRVVIEFDDGTKIEIVHEEKSGFYIGHEISIPIII